MRNVMITTIGEDYVLAAAGQGPVIAPGSSSPMPRATPFFPTSAGFRAGDRVRRRRGAGDGDRVLLPRGRSDAVQTRSPLTTTADQGIFLVISFAVLGACLISDAIYVIADPRTRTRAAY